MSTSLNINNLSVYINGKGNEERIVAAGEPLRFAQLRNWRLNFLETLPKTARWCLRTASACLGLHICRPYRGFQPGSLRSLND
jgi:hypothetical protein